MSNLRWGIMGLGRIAGSFVEDLALIDGHILQAVGSRSIEKANSFKEKYKAHSAHGSYEDLCNDPEVDIIYIATPHNFHKENSLLAMKAGKHVLCEKPLGISVKEVEEMVACAKKESVFFMEAFWSRFNPCIQEIKHKVDSGVIGKVHFVDSLFSFKPNYDPKGRLLNPHLAGGALYDIGVYPLFLSYLILGVPQKIKGSVIIGDTGVDETSSAILEYTNSRAHIYQSIRHHGDMNAKIYGDKGYIEIHGKWHEATEYSIVIDENTEKFTVPKVGRGYSHEAMHCKSCIEKGLNESPLWSWEDSLNLAELVEGVKKGE